VQAYIGRKVFMDSKSMVPKTFKVKESEANVFKIPFEKHFAENDEVETFKQLGELTIHNMGWGYTCFISSFALFISEKEVKVKKSAVIKAFSFINTMDAFK